MTDRHKQLEAKWSSKPSNNKKWKKNLNLPTVIIKKGEPDTQLNKCNRLKKLNVIIVSVNYNDYLSITLKENKKIFDNITVITSNDDYLCHKICEKYDINFIKTDIMYENGAKFNKGKAINLGISSIKDPDFILLIDADVIVTNPINLEITNDDTLYTSSRYICKSYDMLKKSHSNIENSLKLESDKGLGFFQLFNFNHDQLDKQKVYPEFSDDASWSDLVFRDKFPKRETVNNLIVHLGDPYTNWEGRKTNRFLTDNELDNIIKENQKFDINNYFDKIYCLNLDRRQDRFEKVKKQFDDNKINFERWSAIDGDNLTESQIKIIDNEISQSKASDLGKIENKYALACLMSHISIIKDAKSKRYNKILIFEDDVRFSVDFTEEIKKVQKLDWSLLYLGSSQFSWENIEIKNGYYLCNNTLSTFAYALTSDIYDDLINLFDNKNKSVDNYLSEIQSKNIGKCLTLFPNIVISDVEDSNIRESKSISEYAEMMRWDLDRFDKKLKVLLVPDIEGWAFDNIAKSIIKYNKQKIHYEIFYSRELYKGKKIDYDKYDFVYVFFEAERLVEESEKVIRGCYSSFWTEDAIFTPKFIASYFSNCKSAIFANDYLKNKISEHLDNDFPTLVLHDSSDDEIFYPIKNQKNEDFTVIFVGNTKRKIKKFEEIKYICEKSGVNLLVCEKIKNNELVNYYNKADICINFSVSEGGPQTFIESSLCEVPMLIRKDNELSKLIPCFTGETKEDFIDVILKLKENRSLCKEMGIKAREVALENFTYRKTSNKFGNFLLELSNQETNKINVCSDLTVFIISFGDNPNYLDCRKSLENQNIEFNIEEIKDISPMSAAFQKMIDNCNTKYYIQVDEDMILYPDSIETIYNVLKSSNENVSTVAHMLNDVHLDFNIYGIKGYKHDILRKYPYNLEIISCEVEQLRRLQDDGYETLMVEKVIGYHSPKWTPELIYERYFDLMEKWKKFKYHWMGELPSKLLKIFQNNPSEINLYALMGAMYSLSTEESIRNREKDFNIRDKNFDNLKKMIEIDDFKHIVNKESKKSELLNRNQMFGEKKN